MARQISQQALDKLSQTHGAEPVVIIEIVTAHSTASGTDIHVSGKIMEIGQVDSVVAISLNETSEEFQLILDDTDDTIKQIINYNDVHLRDVSVYQWFEGLNWEDRFLIFQGKINSPISWSETDRTVKMSVVSQLEGAFSDLPDDMIGKVWPECFGTSVHQKAIQVDFKHSGTLGDPVGLHDFTLPSRISAVSVIENYLNSLGVLYAIAAGFAGILGLDQAEEQLEDKANGFFAQAGQKTEEIAELNQLLADQKATEVNSFRVIGGEHFPRGNLKLIINDAIFTGSFSGTQGQEGADIFRVSCSDHPERKNFHLNTTPCGNPGCAFGNCKTFPYAEGFSVTQVTYNTFFVPTGNILGDQAGAFFAQGGASVSIYSDEPLRYFVSITPGRVAKVASFSDFNGERVLVDVPENMYRVYTQGFGGVSVKVVEVNDALSKQDPAYEDTIYVTYASAISSNPIEIMKYLIGKYADIGYDHDSFARCSAALGNYPMHFCLTQKKNIVTVLKELAFMSRTALSIKSGKFFCRYLPAEPTSVFTFSEDNVLTQSIELGFTGTEELVTKYLATWRAHGAQDEDNKVVMRYNVKQYGTHQVDVDMYGHTWKKLKFQAALDSLNVETFDGVTLDFNGEYASIGPVLGDVEEGNYNPNTNTMDFVVWTGVRSGEMESYELAYPQAVSTQLKFPDEIATAAGNSGGDGPGNSAGGRIERKGRKQGVTIQFGNDDPYQDGNRKTQDRGSSKPSDVGDTSPGSPSTAPVGQANLGDAPPRTTDITDGTIVNSSDVFWIDIRTTEVADSDNPGQTATFDTFFKEITNSKLKGRTDAIWKDSGGEEAEFDFKFDDGGGKFGAGTAFLQ
ncbi:MAG: hypothetical protein ACW987_14015 [Candidatus Thorarchaeota archaeon]|jgi:hypothetical protein